MPSASRERNFGLASAELFDVECDCRQETWLQWRLRPGRIVASLSDPDPPLCDNTSFANLIAVPFCIRGRRLWRLKDNAHPLHLSERGYAGLGHRCRGRGCRDTHRLAKQNLFSKHLVSQQVLCLVGCFHKQLLKMIASLLPEVGLNTCNLSERYLVLTKAIVRA
ncbi:hypothetical protein J6590_017405 [Homalodisca vitripennis]|nr:hypothetical protein J6590_017405 [Homalodisca vitripennis]